MAAYFHQFAPTTTFLVLYDTDIASASLLAEKFVALNVVVDAIVVVGPFIHKDVFKQEDLATAEGDMASTIAQLENISCRVIYLAADTDPPNSLVGQLHLTPNSVNIFARRLVLRDGLFITGHTETGAHLEGGKLPDHVDRSEESDDELENVEVKNSATSMSIIKEILQAGDAQQRKEIEEETAAKQSSTSSSLNNDNVLFSGIFVMNYKYVHTLNYFLFHMSDELRDAGVSVCILPHVTGELPSNDYLNLTIRWFNSISHSIIQPTHYIITPFQHSFSYMLSTHPHRGGITITH